MATNKNIDEKIKTIIPVKYNSKIYNACDKKEYCRGKKCIGINSRYNNNLEKKASLQLIYSVYKIENGIAFCQSWDISGREYNEKIPIKHLESYPV